MVCVKCGKILEECDRDVPGDILDNDECPDGCEYKSDRGINS